MKQLNIDEAAQSIAVGIQSCSGSLFREIPQQGLLKDVRSGCVPAACSVNSLLFFLQRGKEELREATALLTAQQTSLEIIVNMCCSDGECCGQQCLGSRAVLTWGALFSLLFDPAVLYMFIDKRTAVLLFDAQMHI